jgi:hypothetical protein
MGSTYFFSCYDDFKSHDIDEVEIIETADFKYMRHLSGQGKCLFQLKRKETAEEYIQDALKNNLGMTVGKFLIPEFCTEIRLTIEDLPKLQPLIDKLDDRHLYEKIIFESYLENGTFVLTEEQRLAAYKEYKESRGI